MPCARHRWVLDEPDVPFGLDVLYEDGDIIVVDKPHFLATMPRGMWYRQSVVMRLRERYGDEGIVPAHRLDRMTAGVLILVRNPQVRGAYQKLFQERRAVKTYECAAPLAPVHPTGSGGHPFAGTLRRALGPGQHTPFPLVRRSHIVKRPGVLQAYELPGAAPNAETLIERAGLIDAAGSALAAPGMRAGSGAASARPLCRYVLHPRTGKTHQLRVHMASLGLPIAGDDLYPAVREPDYADFSRPLQLVARRLEFTDPITGQPRAFTSRIPLG